MISSVAHLPLRMVDSRPQDGSQEGPLLTIMGYLLPLGERSAPVRYDGFMLPLPYLRFIAEGVRAAGGDVGRWLGLSGLTEADLASASVELNFVVSARRTASGQWTSFASKSSSATPSR